MAESRQRVVIIGAGFGGLACARALAGERVAVTLVDRNNYHLFTPLLYQVASSLLNPSDIAFPVRTVFRRKRNVTVRRAEVTGIDYERRSLATADGGEIPYDRLVLATGSTTNYFGMKEIEASAFGLKDLPEAMELRNHVLSCFERAAMEPDEDARRKWMTFVVVGGGPTGVEYAGALSELIKLVLRKDFPELDMAEVRIVLVELMDSVLPMFRESLTDYAAEELRRRRIHVRLSTRLTGIEGDKIILEGGVEIRARTLVWAAGVKANALDDGLRTSRSGRVEVDDRLRVVDREGVYAIGDLASLVQDGSEVPMLAPPAIQQGIHTARNIVRDLAGKRLLPFKYKDKGVMATIGRNAAVTQSGPFSLTGFMGWLAWLVLHLFYIIGFRNRFVVLLGWGWEYVRADRPVRAIARARKRDEAGPGTMSD